MRDPAATAQRQQARQQSLVVNIVTLPLRTLGVLMGSLLLSISIECMGMYCFWPDQGWHHAQSMLDYELEQLSSQFTRSLVLQEPGHTAHMVIDGAYEWVFVKTRLIEWVEHASTHSRAPRLSEARDFRYYLSQVYRWTEGYLIAAAFTVLTFLVRLLVLLLTLPLFVMAAFVGFVDGLVRRDIRKFGAGHESGFIYHRAKAALVPIAVMPWILYLTLPISVHPLLILLPCAVLLAVVANITASSFKKYL
ncbi:TIGR03747 family integrating conjugative element membrane protein [Pseudomonas citronellolis]|uniref:TIGR03747 family integrating conjugative element membrane protein n=1 Tax=Pseudomonas citronellolis TaxID=53408 RepID=UPI0021C214F8|nr:TIGR03747 family integrating conjugative element membrane protein [Pseudomonas citronellolis]UXJ50124.1 TIGR03747 family integrating conjugative element membrane protein [Pseudomonas citronellolis]